MPACQGLAAPGRQSFAFASAIPAAPSDEGLVLRLCMPADVTLHSARRSSHVSNLGSSHLQAHMTSDPHAEWAQARKRFGFMLKAWRAKNGWAGQTAEDWQKSCPDLLPFKILNSVWTGLELARNERTAPATFKALGDVNQALSRLDRGVIPDRKLRERVDGAEPIRHTDGTPWTHVDFYRAFWGELEIPADLQESEPMTEAEAEAWSETWRSEFRRVQLRRNLRPRDALAQLLGEMLPAPPTQKIAALEDLAFGFACLTPQDKDLMALAKAALDRWGSRF